MTGGPVGTQVERTVLAWDRTALALLGNGALLLLREVRTAGTPAFDAALVALVAALTVGLFARRRARALRHPAAAAGAPGAPLVAGVAVLVVGVVVSTVLLLRAAS